MEEIVTETTEGIMEVVNVIAKEKMHVRENAPLIGIRFVREKAVADVLNHVLKQGLL